MPRGCHGGLPLCFPTAGLSASVLRSAPCPRGRFLLDNSCFSPGRFPGSSDCLLDHLLSIFLVLLLSLTYSCSLVVLLALYIFDFSFLLMGVEGHTCLTCPVQLYQAEVINLYELGLLIHKARVVASGLQVTSRCSVPGT